MGGTLFFGSKSKQRPLRRGNHFDGSVWKFWDSLSVSQQNFPYGFPVIAHLGANHPSSIPTILSSCGGGFIPVLISEISFTSGLLAIIVRVSVSS